MKTGLITSGVPRHIALGVQDLSVRELPLEAVKKSVHRPLWFLKTGKGTEEKVFLSGPDKIAMYGSESLSVTSPNFNHQTLGMVVAAAQGSGSVTKRILGDDAKKAYIRIWIDVLECEVDNYSRNSIGIIKTDDNGDKVVDADTPKVQGHKIKFYATYETGFEVGNAAIKEGKMVDGSTKSNMYPLIDLESDFRGKAYNNIGLVLAKMNASDISVQDFEINKAMPLFVSIFERENEKTTGKPVKTKLSSLKVKSAFKQGVVNPLTKVNEDMKTILPGEWNNTTDPAIAKKYSGIGKAHFYYNHLETVFQKLVNREAEMWGQIKEWNDGKTENSRIWYDFIGNSKDEIKEEEQFMIDILTLKTTKGIPYSTIQLEKDTTVSFADGKGEEISLSSKTPIYLKGGSDGVMTDKVYESKIREFMKEYLDVDSRVMVIPKNQETLIYDTGFAELATKEELCNFIAVRKNTGLFLATDSVNEKGTFLEANDAKGVGNVLKARLALAPESEFFGTGSFRAVIMGQTGLMADDTVLDRLPMTFHAIQKFAGYMSGPAWLAGNDFENGDNSRIEILKDIQPEFISQSGQNVLYRSQVVFATDYDDTFKHVPGFQTVYVNDRSVLNNPFVMMATIGIETVMDDAHRAHAGNSKLSNPEFLDSVENYVSDALNGVFDGRFPIKVTASIDSYDAALGYSWTLNVEIGANSQRTVQQSYITARRAEDMLTAA